MKKINWLFLFLSVTTLSFAQETIKLQVKENTEPCVGVAPMDCLQVKEGNTKNWSNFYSSIEGFDYQPGFSYKLKVIKSKTPTVNGQLPSDVSAYQYKLKKIVSKKKVKSIIAKNNLTTNKKMILTELNGKKLDKGNVYATFDSEKKTIYGKSACNRFNASYTQKGDEINIKSGMQTLMACDQENMQLEQDFTKALEGNYKIVTSENKTQFLNSDKKVIMEFTIPTDDSIWKFVDGKKWKLFMLDNMGQDFGDIHIQFNLKEHKVTGNSGCNSFFGNFNAKEDKINLDNLATTAMGCLDDEVNQREQKILSYLTHKDLRFDVAEQVINFYVGDKLVMIYGLQQ